MGKENSRQCLADHRSRPISRRVSERYSFLAETGMEVEKPPEVSKGSHRHSGERDMTTTGSDAGGSSTDNPLSILTPSGDIENCDI
jgi:hypothetical protein